jgi:SAM-dependent methyltransferase
MGAVSGPGILAVAKRRWREAAQHAGAWGATRELTGDLWYWLRDSTPERRRARYGDIEYDFESGANTTAANVGWRTRLLAAVAGAPYQPSEPALFHAMIRALPLRPAEFTFVDIGSGKGRALLLAAEHGFRDVAGVELVPELHAIAVENIRQWQAADRSGRRIVAQLGDAREFDFPAAPLVVYLFNPLPEAALRAVIARLERSLAQAPRAVYILYHNPLLERVLAAAAGFERLDGTHQYVVYRARCS